MKHKPRVIRPYDNRKVPPSKNPFGKASAVSMAVIACLFLTAFATLEPEKPAHLTAYAITPRPGDKVLLRNLVDAMNVEAEGDDWLEAILAAQKSKEARHGK